MKILLLCGGRVGSYTLAKWLSKELNLKFFDELDHSIDYKKVDNIIVKRTISNNDFNLDHVAYFDKIIKLYRKNTLKQAESNLYAIRNKKWHHTSETEPDGFYEIDENFLIKNHKEIWITKNFIDKENKELLQLNFGFEISYEEIFETFVGEKLIEDYLGFKSSTKIDVSLKLRKENQQHLINSYEREIESLQSIKIEMYDLKNKNKVLRKENKNLKDENKDLKKSIGSLQKNKYKLI
jgi:cell division protein FtsB